MAKVLRTYRHAVCKRVGMSHSQTSQSGFSMLEVMIAMVIMTIGIASLFGAMGTAAQVADTARGRDLALKEIEAVIEEIKPTSFEYIGGHEGWHDVAGLSAPTGRERVLQIWAVDEDDVANSGDNMRHLRLRCEWVDQSGFQFLQCDYYAGQTN